MTTHITVSSRTINEGMMTLIFSFLLPEPLYIEIEILLNLLWQKKKTFQFQCTKVHVRERKNQSHHAFIDSVTRHMQLCE